MGILGMGWQEIALIAVVAVMIFGPDKLPEMAGQAGKLMRDFRRITQDMTGEFEKQTGVSVKDLKSNVDKEIAGIKSEMAGTTSSVQRELNSVKSSVSKTATSVSKSVSAAASSKSGSGTKSTTGSKSSSTAKKATSASTSKSSSTTNKSAGSTTKTAAPAPAKASKNDPLADVSFMDNTGESSTNGASKANGKPAGAEASPTQADALARARSRRQTAGYNQGPPSLS